MLLTRCCNRVHCSMLLWSLFFFCDKHAVLHWLVFCAPSHIISPVFHLPSSVFLHPSATVVTTCSYTTWAATASIPKATQCSMMVMAPAPAAPTCPALPTPTTATVSLDCSCNLAHDA